MISRSKTRVMGKKVSTVIESSEALLGVGGPNIANRVLGVVRSHAVEVVAQCPFSGMNPDLSVRSLVWRRQHALTTSDQSQAYDYGALVLTVALCRGRRNNGQRMKRGGQGTVG